jgi:ADP-ribosylglycohydrolase
MQIDQPPEQQQQQQQQQDEAAQHQQQQLEAIVQQLGAGTPLIEADPAYVFCFVSLPGEQSAAVLGFAAQAAAEL